MKNLQDFYYKNLSQIIILIGGKKMMIRRIYNVTKRKLERKGKNFKLLVV